MAPTQRMVHRNWLFLLTITLLLSFPMRVRAETPGAEELFQKLLQSFQTVDFEGKLMPISLIPEGDPVREALVIRKAPDKQRIEFIRPTEMHGMGMVMRGSERWRIHSERTRERRPFLSRPPNRMMDHFPLKNIQLLLQNYDVRVLDGGSVAGRSTYLLEIVPKVTGRPSRKLWMDAEMGVILKMENYDSQKRLRNLFAYSEVNFEPEIDEEIFRSRHRTKQEKRPRGKPDREELWNHNQGKPDLEKLRKEVQLNIALPDQAPAGFILQDIQVVRFGERKNVHLRYADGLASLSVFQSPSDEGRRGDRLPRPGGKVKKMNIGGIECELMFTGPMLIFRWHYEGIYLTLMGELEQKEMAGIVGSFISKRK